MTRRTNRPRGVAMRAKSTQRKTSKPKRAPAKSSRPRSSRDKVRAYRARMRAKGLRLVQMWLPDTSTAEFAAQAHRDSLAIANSPAEKEDQAFLELDLLVEHPGGRQGVDVRLAARAPQAALDLKRR